ncbi:MAG: replicative DNA helicase [Lachnospiraceae bacterium]|nr:replicative DNA helicase [Lachnospiraceae bacterium]
MDEQIIKKVMPHNKEAEQSVIGAMLMDRDVISDTADLLTGEDFYYKQYGVIFEAMKSLYREGEPVDMVTLTDRLKQNGIAEEVAGPAQIVEIMQAVPTAVNARNYAKIVQDNSLLRRLIRLCENVEKDSYLAADKVENILGKTEEEIFKLVQSMSGSKDFVPMSSIVVDVLNRMEEAAKTGGKITGIPTGFTALDDKLAGLHGGELIIVAARPAMGKTAFVLNIVQHLAVRKQIPCAVFSLEMTKQDLAARLLSIGSMVDSGNIKLGTMPDEDWEKILWGSEELAKAPLYLDDNASINMSEFRSKCRKLKQNAGIKLIVLDYLQLMNSTGKVESRQQFIADVSRSLKNLAKELDVPIIALSQINRSVDKASDHKPGLADLRESGAIEQDADVVMFIYRDEVYNPDTTTKPNTAEIIIDKHRNGETGTIELVWIGKFTKFANPEKKYN